MMYDLFAEFYENSSDEKPSYKVMMGHHKFFDGELEKEGFIEDPDSDEGYMDYVKDNATQEDLEKWTLSLFDEEMRSIFLDEEYERIRIKAFEVELIDGKIQPFGVWLSKTYVEFTYSKSMTPVFFSDKYPKDDKRCKRCFYIPLIKLKRHFNVKTLIGVKEKLMEMNDERQWTYRDLNKLFTQIKETIVIDPEIEPQHNSFLRKVLPHEVLDYDFSDYADCLYAHSMYYLIDGNIDEGKSMLKIAYLLGNLRAGQALQYGYGAGWFGERNYDEMIKILRQLVKKKHCAAMNSYATAYEYGLGVKKNKRMALFWYKKAVEEKYLDAISNIALFYLFENEPYKDVKQGLKYAKLGAKMGDEECMNALGLCYEEGIGVKTNPNKAFEWFTKAVENGAAAMAEHNLARCYRQGIGTQKNIAKADELEIMAIEHGCKPNYKLISIPKLIEDWIAVAEEGREVLFVRKEDKDNPEALGMLVHCDKSNCYSFGLVQKFLKFRMMEIIPDDVKAHNSFRDILIYNVSKECIRQMKDEFKRQIEIWNNLEIKWDYEFTEEFHCHSKLDK